MTKRSLNFLTLATFIFTAAIAAQAQFEKLAGQIPSLPGMLNFTVGSGAQYQIISKDGNGNATMTMAVVGTENSGGSDSYWVEFDVEAPEGGGFFKQLVSLQNGKPEVKRMIMQTHGQPPMEMPVGMMNQYSAKNAGGMAAGERVGTETVTVPAGTFICEHYRGSDRGQASDVWFSSKTKIAPYGMVKIDSSDASMVLIKVLDHATSKIQGEPRKFSIPGH